MSERDRSSSGSFGDIRPGDPDTSDRPDLYRLLVQGVVDYAIYALTPDGVIASWNEGAQRLKGYAPSEVLGRPFAMLYPPEDRHRSGEALRIARTRGRFEGEGWRIRKDGTRFWANAVITALHDSTGGLRGFAKVTRDLTERREAEEQRLADAVRLATEETARRAAETHSRELERLVSILEEQVAELEVQQEELQLLATQVADANAQLKAAMASADAARAEASAANTAKSTFLAVMSHEIRTPLNAIVGFTDLLADEIMGPLNDKQWDQLARVRTSARFLMTLLENVLTLSRVEAGHETIRVGKGDACALARESAALLAPTAHMRGLRLEIDVPEGPCWIWTDPTKLRQVLMNLISNAIKYTDQGSVTLTVRSDEDVVRFAVRDTGVGMSAVAVQHVFDAYWRGDHARWDRPSGTGLGLMVTRKLVDMLGGSITVDSEISAGSTFTVALPVHGPVQPDHPTG